MSSWPKCIYLNPDGRQYADQCSLESLAEVSRAESTEMPTGSSGDPVFRKGRTVLSPLPIVSLFFAACVHLNAADAAVISISVSALRKEAVAVCLN